MKVKIMAISLFLIFIIPYNSSAHFIFSDIEINVEEISPIPLGKEITAEVNVTFTWGFGAIIPLPVKIYVEAENVPEWLSVRFSPSEFTITPAKLMGGEVSKTVKMMLKANKETTAYSIYSFSLHVYTNGSFLIKGCEKRKEISVMEDFVDNGLTIEAPSAVHLYKGDEEMIMLNITNNCNANINVELSTENATGFSFTFDKRIFSIPPKTKKSVLVTIKAEEIRETNAKIKLTYYPVGHQEKKNYEEYQMNLFSEAKAGGGGAIAVGLIIILIGIIVFIIWKKKF